MADTDSLPPKWKLATIEDAMAAIIDYRGKTPEKTTFGVPLVTAKIVKAGRIMPPDEFIAEKDYDAWMRRGMVHPGDVVVTTEAPLGEVAQLDERKVALAQRLIALRGKPDLVDNTFLRFSMQSALVQDQLHARASGTTVLGIRQSELRKVELALPPFPEQRAIAGVLGALDDKIEVNRKTARVLEGIARAVFTSWFVDFDPVRRRATSHPGSAAPLPADLAALFSKRLVDSPIGEVPEGWRVGTIGDIADAARDGVDPGEIDADTPYIGLEHMPRRCIALDQWEHAGKVTSGKSRFRRGQILFGKLRPYFHKVGVAPVDGVCSTDIIVAEPKKPCWMALALGHLSSDALVKHADGSSTGTKMPRTNWRDLAAFEIAIPPEAIAARASALIAPIVQRMETGIHANRTLAALRDALLPKLISGELRIADAEKIVGRAT
jgi:type I restriction enzyme S subunit